MTNTEPLLHIFGEVLFDHFPDGSRVLGGAPFNVAWHLQAFGQAPRFISRVGDDAPGRAVAAAMDAWGMRRDALQIDAEHPTGTVQVLIENDEPRYDIVPGCAYDFIAEEKDRAPSAGIFYHGSLAARTPAARAALLGARNLHQGKIFVDVNLRPPWWNHATLAPMLEGADWIKLNEHELIALCPGHPDLEAAMLAFAERFNPDTLVVTRGAEGALACDRRGHFVSVAPSPVAVVDTVGAGDAFAALLLLGMLEQWPLKTALERAQAFAGALVGRRGATVDDASFYAGFAAQWF